MTESKENLVLETRGVHRTLGEGIDKVHVLRGIDLRLERGKTYSIVGPSGCGKSTLLYLLGLLDRPDAGEIWLAGQRVDHAAEAERTRIRGRRIGFVFQFHFLLSEFSAAENLTLPMLKHLPIDRETALERARELLGLVGLGDKTARKGNQLSGGERQRVAVARALANDPDLILADEPTGNLDYQNSKALFDQLQALAHELNRTILVVTHNLDLARACDHCFHMRDGLFE
ncbi:ABC transporter ATP-binding protein [Puniceicoccales bacterium CK1056]|uniref:ABC transporter ATP-binding protein n=1 Tax=Oceanipulchritudo coccoides TaxID=2706888 RepID=A0A6B2M3X6_9BACT|nr:ABC transporter ATP-binding protein [Oceanipulchritudo coccoides]NDV62360.1 ABC transporter ATP-binding protein [Oceanipulchritudo coccoides]